MNCAVRRRLPWAQLHVPRKSDEFNELPLFFAILQSWLAGVRMPGILLAYAGNYASYSSPGMAQLDHDRGITTVYGGQDASRLLWADVVFAVLHISIVAGCNLQQE